MSDLFSTVYYKKGLWPIKCMMEPGQCCVYYYLTWVTFCFCVKLDAKTRLQSPSESHVLQTAVCVLLPSSPGLLHLCLWPSGAVQLCMCRAVGWIKEKWCITLVCKKKVGEVQDIHSQSKRSSTVPNGGSLASFRVCVVLCAAINANTLFYLEKINIG